MFELILLIIILAFLFEFMDSAAGMGFGTGLAPLLLLLGYSPLQVVPTLLISEAISGLIDAYFDNEFENVDFSFRPLSYSTKLALIIALFGCIAIIFSIFLTYVALDLPVSFIKIYVAILVLLMGVFEIFRTRITQKDDVDPKPRMLICFAAIAGFNKGIGGGGYGPVITLGQIHSGIYEKSATAIVSFSESIVSVVGIFTFFLTSVVAGVDIDLILLPSVFAGGYIGALLTPYITRVLPNKIWRYIIPTYAIGIGIFLLMKLFFL